MSRDNPKACLAYGTSLAGCDRRHRLPDPTRHPEQAQHRRLVSAAGQNAPAYEEVSADDAVGRTRRENLEHARPPAIGERGATSPPPEPTPPDRAAWPPGSNPHDARRLDTFAVSPRVIRPPTRTHRHWNDSNQDRIPILLTIAPVLGNRSISAVKRADGLSGIWSNFVSPQPPCRFLAWLQSGRRPISAVVRSDACQHLSLASLGPRSMWSAAWSARPAFNDRRSRSAAPASAAAPPTSASPSAPPSWASPACAPIWLTG